MSGVMPIMRARPYTIVRPGGFDYNDTDRHRLVLLQGDTGQAGDPRDGVVVRRQIAELLVDSLASEAAIRKTFELVAERGPTPSEFDSLFADLDACRDSANMPLAQEHDRIRDDLAQFSAR